MLDTRQANRLDLGGIRPLMPGCAALQLPQIEGQFSQLREVEEMDLNRAALRAACYEVARAVYWEPNNPEAFCLDAINPVARRYYKTALIEAKGFQDAGLDPNMIVRAVRYLGQMHAIPPQREHPAWFADSLAVLAELVCPGDVPHGLSVEFLRDVQRGIDRTLAAGE